MIQGGWVYFLLLPLLVAGFGEGIVSKNVLGPSLLRAP